MKVQQYFYKLIKKIKHIFKYKMEVIYILSIIGSLIATNIILKKFICKSKCCSLCDCEIELEKKEDAHGNILREIKIMRKSTFLEK